MDSNLTYNNFTGSHRIKNAAMFTAENETDQFNDDDSSDFNIMINVNKKLQLPQYFEVLVRSAGCGVKMEDLNTLQCDLEKLLSACVVRKRLLLSRFNLPEQDNRTENQICEYCEKQCFLTKPINEDSSYAGARNQNSCNMKNNIPIINSISPSLPTLSMTANNLSGNDTATSFWLFSESYFGNIRESDLAVVNELIEESKRDIYYRNIKMNKEIYTQCPYFPKLTRNTQKHNDRMEFKKKKRGRNNQISLELERCLKELIAIRRSNITELLKLRVDVLQHLYSQ